jgi:hypothetical protein
MIRAPVSTGPPAAKGTTKVMGRVGQSSALAVATDAMSAVAAAIVIGDAMTFAPSAGRFFVPLLLRCCLLLNPR